MDTRILGRSGLSVSRLCLGTMTFGGRTDEAEAGRIYGRAREAGVNFVDTADVYTEGRSEEFVGRLIADHRDDVVLASKVGATGYGAPNRSGLSRAWMMRGVKASLKRLGTDRLDVLYLHKEDPSTPLEEVVRTLEDMVRSGMILHFGVSNHAAWRVAELKALCDAANISRPVVNQPYYHALKRTIETDILPLCAAYEMAVFPYSPIARGVLSGKYSGDQVPSDSRAGVSDTRILETEFKAETLAAADRFVALAKAKGVAPTAYAIAFVLANPMVTGAIVGPRTEAQFAAYLEALDVDWGPSDEDAVDEVVPPGSTAVRHFVDPQYPVEGRPRPAW